MKKVKYFSTFVFLFVSIILNAQTFVWTGATNSDFFDETNWKDSVTNVVPNNGSIDDGVTINLALEISNAASTITANGIITLGTGSLSVSFSNLNATSFSGGNVVVNEGAYIELNSSTPLSNAVQVNLTSGLSWVKTINFSARNVSIFNLGQIKINGNASVYKTNLRLDNYYLKGCVIRPILASITPLTLYDDINLQNTSASITVNTIHRGESITNSMNNKTESFVLKKGYMVTFADAPDGTGKSKNYIASENDLVINSLPKVLQNSISFIRVLPWNWVTKKGRTSTGSDLNTSWRYQWNNNESSSTDIEYTPMSAFGFQADDDADIALYIGKYNSTHVMAFNESDNCNGQSGQYGNPKLCVTDEAVRIYKNLMKTGMRLVSPSGTEGAATTWLKEFHTKATAQDIRIDVIGVHWYDWGSNPSSNPNPTAAQVFARFKTYLTSVYNLYGLPIWITEFNANPYRSTAIQLGFMELALPYLETLPYVERYNWFQPNPTPLIDNDNENLVGPGEFYTTRPPSNADLTTVGTTYKNQISSAAIPTPTVDANNNLNLFTYQNIAINKTATANSSYTSSYPASNAVDGDLTSVTSQWFANIGVTSDQNYTPLPAWIDVDLQGSYTIDSFRIIEALRAVKDFKFEVWDGSLNSGAGGWSTALNVIGNPSSPLTTFKNITPVTTTKVRVYVTAHNSSSNIRMYELEVFGKLSETLDIKQFVKESFSLHPNPATNGIINILGDEEVNSVIVYNTIGN